MLEVGENVRPLRYFTLYVELYVRVQAPHCEEERLDGYLANLAILDEAATTATSLMGLVSGLAHLVV
jgi:hypothetical protein